MNGVETLLPYVPTWAAVALAFIFALIALWKQRDRSRESAWQRLLGLIDKLAKQRDVAEERVESLERDNARLRRDLHEALKLADNRRGDRD